MNKKKNKKIKISQSYKKVGEIKISLKRENEILRELSAYLFQLVQASGDMFSYLTKKIERLEKRKGGKL